MGDTRRITGTIESWVARIPPGFGRTRPDIHYRLFAPVLLAQLIWVARAGRIAWAPGLLLFAGGIATWTLLEYVLHRFSFHSQSENPLIRPFNSGLHKLHHDAPSSLHYVAAPIVMAAPVYSLCFLIFRLLSGSTDRALLLGSGLVFSFLFYEFTHYSAHQRSPRTRVMKYLKKHHMRHHFGDEQKLFGVTSPFWDYVFGTQSRVAKRPARPAARPRSAAS